MRALKTAVLAAGFAMCASSALATDPNIVFQVTPQPASVTLSRAELATFAAYRVDITNDSPHAATSVKLQAKTSVAGSSDASPFVSASGASGVSCAPTYAPPSTAVECQIGVLAARATVTFSITFAAPASGTRIDLASRTSHQIAQLGPNPPTVESPERVVSTQLVPPNPLQVATFLPQASGGTVFTGDNGGVALAADTATTTVNVPSSTTVVVDETPDTSAPFCPGLSECPPNSTRLAIPGLFLLDPLTITLRLDTSIVPKTRGHKPKGRDSDDDDDDDERNDDRGHGRPGSLIANAKVYYQPDPTPGNLNPDAVLVYACSVTGGPSAGMPCIASRTAFTRKTAPTREFIGDWQFIIFAVDNGRYFL